MLQKHIYFLVHPKSEIENGRAIKNESVNNKQMLTQKLMFEVFMQISTYNFLMLIFGGYF